jgi:putative ABC transport system ATP-binding protein
MSSPAPLIKTHKLSKIYYMDFGEIRPLKEVDLEIFSGDSISIMGPSGSGKSTLLHLLGCLDTPTSGELYFEGKIVNAYSDEELSAIRSEQIGFVFQSFNLLPNLNVFENVILPFQYQKKRRVDAKERTLQVIDKVGLSHRVYHKTNQLSGGEMQRAAIARALAISPSLILADEPTGNLDSANSLAILSLLREVNRSGVTVIIVTHDSQVSAQFQKKYRMRDGILENV